MKILFASGGQLLKSWANGLVTGREQFDASTRQI
jgi:hypothetical protein